MPQHIHGSTRAALCLQPSPILTDAALYPARHRLDGYSFIVTVRAEPPFDANDVIGWRMC
jgi:hypothetical protein